MELLARRAIGLMEGDAAVSGPGQASSGCSLQKSLLTVSSPTMAYGELNAFAPQTYNGKPGCYHSNGLAAADCCQPSALPRAVALENNWVNHMVRERRGLVQSAIRGRAQPWPRCL